MLGIWEERVTGNQQLGIRKKRREIVWRFLGVFMWERGEGKTIPLFSFYPEGGRGENDDIPTP